MRVVVIYKNDSEHARDVIDFMRDLKHQTGYDLEEMDPDTREGADMCRTYDVVEYPSILALDSDGVMQTMWRGMLPTISEVGYYASLE